MKRRAYQIDAMLGIRKHRSFFLLWRRQGGKSTTLASAAIDEMTATPGRLVTYASASLLLGREIIQKESQVLQMAIRDAMEEAAKTGLRLETADAKSAKAVDLNPYHFAELFEALRLEFRLWHDRTTCSRTQVIAPNAATARGWSGTVILDEFAFIPDFQDLWEAVEPIVSSDPGFKFIGATTPPKDDTHYSYALTDPPVDLKFEVNPRGNWYRSDAGELIHRVDVFDAHAAGQKLYDRKTGAELTPEEHRKTYGDLDAWRRNYAIEHVVGGSAACGVIELRTAQLKGADKCVLFIVDDDAQFQEALRRIPQLLRGRGACGLGYDVATTEKATSNPSSFSFVQRAGNEFIVPAVVIWKTRDPIVAEERVTRLTELATNQDTDAKARRLCIDATNARLFAATLASHLAPIVPVQLVVGSETVPIRGAVQSKNWKTFLGDGLTAALSENRMVVPSARYLWDDWRLVIKSGGLYTATPDAQGRHADTFDSTKLGLWALTGSTGEITATLI